MLTSDQKRDIIKFIGTMGEETVWGQSESLGGELNSYEVDLFLTCCANILMDSGIHVLDTN